MSCELIGFKLNLIFVNNNELLLLSYIFGRKPFFIVKKALKKAK